MRIVRSLLRITIGTILGLASLAMVFGFGLKTYGERRLVRARLAFESRHGSLDAASYFHPVPPLNRNGAALMAMAAERVQLTGQTSDLVADAAILPRSSWPPEMVATVDSQRQLHNDALVLLHMGASLSESDFSAVALTGSTDSGLSILGLLSCARLLSATARDQIYQGDVKGFQRSVESLQGLTEALGLELELNFQTSAWTAENFLLTLTAELVKNPEVNRETLLRLQEAQLKTDIEQGFRRFLAWYAVDSIYPADEPAATPMHNSRAATWPPSKLYNRFLFDLSDEVHAAVELEQFTAAVDRLMMPLTQWTDPPPDQGALFSEFSLVAARAQITATSRSVVHSALELRLTPPTHRLQALPAITSKVSPVSGEGIAASVQADGSFVIWARDADALATRLYFGRFNPPPPVRIAVSTAQTS